MLTTRDKQRVKAFLAGSPWQPTSRGVMATVWLEDDAIDPECIPDGVRVDEIMWAHRDRTGCVPVRLVKKK